MKKTCGYQTSDGRFFEEEDVAREHQEKLDAKYMRERRRLEMIQKVVNLRSRGGAYKIFFCKEQRDLSLSEVETYLKDDYSYHFSFCSNGDIQETFRSFGDPGTATGIDVGRAAFLVDVLLEKHEKELKAIKDLI